MSVACVVPIPLILPLRRCVHGVYLAPWLADDHGNPYCSGCHNFGAVHNPQPVELPTRSSTALNSERHRGEGGCPKCFATSHYAHGNVWVCAECHAQFPAPRHVQRAAAVAAEEAECL